MLTLITLVALAVSIVGNVILIIEGCRKNRS